MTNEERWLARTAAAAETVLRNYRPPSQSQLVFVDRICPCCGVKHCGPWLACVQCKHELDGNRR